MKQRRQITIADAIPAHWLDSLGEGNRIGMGFDVATTEKAKSNPSALAVAEKVGVDFYIRLLVRWKSSDPDIAEAIIRHVLDQIESRRRKARKLCIDATSEKFFAKNLKRNLAGVIPVELVVSSESTQYLGEPMNFKVYLGNLYINTIDDGRLALPDEKWVSDDARQVKRDKGTFIAEIDEDGNHADAFDACKLALHSLITRSGTVEADAARVGTFGSTGTDGRRFKNPYANKYTTGAKINV